MCSVFLNFRIDFMELIYKNDYGATYRIQNSPNPEVSMQLVVDTVALFMSEKDLQQLLVIVRGSHKPCNCEDCKGSPCNKIWCSSPMIDICLKVNEPILKKMEDLIEGTQFILNLDATLDTYRIKPKKS